MVRYLAGLPCLIYRYGWQAMPTHLDVYVDTDYAGCASTRRSRSGGAALLGGCLVKHWFKDTVHHLALEWRSTAPWHSPRSCSGVGASVFDERYRMGYQSQSTLRRNCCNRNCTQEGPWEDKALGHHRFVDPRPGEVEEDLIGKGSRHRQSGRRTH